MERYLGIGRSGVGNMTVDRDLQRETYRVTEGNTPDLTRESSEMRHRPGKRDLGERETWREEHTLR